MKMPIKLMMGVLTMTFSQMLYAGVAKVVIMKGQVKARYLDGTMVDVKVDQSIPEGATLQTAEKSFVKLIFIDKSLMNLGPNSQMIINAFPKKEAGIITLVKGQIRSQVTKDYMEMDDKSKSKLYIKTKTAAMGIRGTDFQINFNPENQNTALITFEGKVAMAHIEKGAREDKFDQRNLEKVVSSEKAVMVERGQISAVNLNVAERAMTPTLLGTKQIDALHDNETGIKESTEINKKQYRNPLPPGADSAIFSNITASSAPEKEKTTKSDPNGFFNAKTGEYKLPAGSIVDLNTVNIIPPPVNAVFDPNSKTYVVPESYGKIDKSTGEYKAPEGLKLGTDGKFVLVDATAYAKTQVINKEEKKEEKKDDKKEDKKEADKKEGDKKEGDKPADATTAQAAAPGAGNRTPASADAATAAATTSAMAIKIDVPKIYDARPEMAIFTNTFAAPVIPRAPAPAGMSEAQRAVAAERISTTETLRQAATDAGVISPTSKVKFIFNAQ
ncbi:MAG: FecR domain-containing protein [Bacteriovorax sp.]|nr:FecR domain-containing protein [Bacteriovorax sp.]